MAYFLDNCVFGVSGTPGTGAIAPGSASSGAQSLAGAGAASGQMLPYSVADAAGAFEFGRGYWNGSTLTRSVILGSSNSGSAINMTSAAIVTVSLLGEDSAPTPWAITGGLPSSMTGTNTTATMTISAGQATDQSKVVSLSWSSFSWAVSNGAAANGCADGATLGNSKTYHMYVCWGSSGYCSYASQTLSMAASSAPSGYQYVVRRLFSFTTTSAGAPVAYNALEASGGALKAWLVTQTLDMNNVSLPTSSRTLYTLTVPQGIKVEVFVRALQSAGASGYFLLTSGDETDVAPSSTIPLYDNYGTSAIIVQPPLTTNTSGQVGARASGTCSIDLETRGFLDWRRV